MNEVLSQDEIDQLLSAINSGDSDVDDFKPVNSARKIKIYDFKRPDKFSKETLKISPPRMARYFPILILTATSIARSMPMA